MLLIIFGMVLYLYYLHFANESVKPDASASSIYIENKPVFASTSGLVSDPFNDPYSPPLKNDGLYFPPDSGDIRGVPRTIYNQMTTIKANNVSNLTGIDSGGLVVGSNSGRIPINMASRSYSPEYTQIGILTKNTKSPSYSTKPQEQTTLDNPLILPLFGRRILNGRDKFQYYSMSNTGFINTKLPIKVNGRSATSDIGCDELYSNDSVYVEGYKEQFRATIYENALFSYIPVL